MSRIIHLQLRAARHVHRLRWGGCVHSGNLAGMVAGCTKPALHLFKLEMLLLDNISGTPRQCMILLYKNL